MARSYTRIFTAIWRNAEFRALHGGAQRLYMLLVTQPDITAAGTLPLTVRRWADMARDTTVDEITEHLTELRNGRFIAVDPSTEELLVRSFVKWDGGYGNSKRQHAIRDAAESVTSVVLRRMLAAEFTRLGLAIGKLADTPPDGPPDTPPDSAPDRPSQDHRDGLAENGPPELSAQVDSASDSAPGATTRFRRVVVTQVERTSTATHNPQPVPPSAGADGAQHLVGDWIDRCRRRPPSRVIGHMSKQIKALLEDGMDPDDIRAGIELWMTKDVSPSVLPSVVNSVMNQQARASPANGYRSQTDANIAAFLGTNPPNLRALPGGAS